MTHPVPRFLLSFCALAVGLFAQERPLPTGAVPVVTSPLSDQAGQVGGSAVTVDLAAHLGLNTERSTFVRFDMTFGKFDVELLPDHAPLSTANFLQYVQESYYENSIIHRTAFFDSEDNLPEVVQGGGYSATVPIDPLPDRRDPIVLEYDYPNERGTLAAARTNEYDSATSQWYFNTSDNSEGLGQTDGEGGYAVFGKVVGSGMAVVDTVGMVNTFLLSAAFTDIPLRFYNGGTITTENLVKVFNIYEVPLYPTSNDDEAVLSFSATSSDPAIVTATVDGSTLTLTPGAAGDATVTVTASTISGDEVETTFTFASGGLVISDQPQDQNVAVGGSATLTVNAPAASGTNTYQWYFHRAGMSAPTAIAGATAATYTDSNVQAADMGAYFVRVTNGDDTVESEAALITTTGGSSRLANLSTRGRIAAGGTLTPGFVLSGTGNKELLVRSVGPTLTGAPFNLSGYISDPFMDLIPLGSADPVKSSDNWGDEANAATIRTTAATVGAFALTEGSADAAVLQALPLPNAAATYGYSVRMKNTVASEAGLAIAEVYDPDLASSQRLVNVSALGFSGTGADALVPGFVISGDGAKTMLIRVAGPSLEAYGVSGRMADPRLRVVPIGQSFTVASNDNWGGAAELKAAFATTGAFDFAADNSLDAAVLVRLPPGGYSVVVEGAANGTGNVIVEAYEVE